MAPSSWSADVKKGFLLGVGLAGAFMFVGFATGIIRTGLR